VAISSYFSTQPWPLLTFASDYLVDSAEMASGESTDQGPLCRRPSSGTLTVGAFLVAAAVAENRLGFWYRMIGRGRTMFAFGGGNGENGVRHAAWGRWSPVTGSAVPGCLLKPDSGGSHRPHAPEFVRLDTSPPMPSTTLPPIRKLLDYEQQRHPMFRR
jgi:hypothetical protein